MITWWSLIHLHPPNIHIIILMSEVLMLEIPLYVMYFCCIDTMDIYHFQN
jgi:hypothetical protein